MLFEELYSYVYEDSDEGKINFFYRATLFAWLVYNDTEVFDIILQTYLDREEYLICEGISRAMTVIEDVTENRFSEATPIREDDEGKIYSHQQHQEVSRLIFADILMNATYERYTKGTEERD